MTSNKLEIARPAATELEIKLKIDSQNQYVLSRD